MSPSIVPSQKGAPATADLPAAAATYDSAARHFVIQPTPWGTLFTHRRLIHAAFPWGPIDAYFELPLSDSVEDKGKLLDTSISRIKIESLGVVPEGAFLARVYGDDEVWMLHFPPRPLVTGLVEKEAAHTPTQPKAKASGIGSNDYKERSFGKVCCNFWHFLEMMLKHGKESDDFLDNFFTNYAIDVGSGLTGNDVRVDFANEVADINVRRLYTDEPKAWELIWQAVTRGGTLKGPASSHWTKGFDKMKPPQFSNIEIARARSGKEVDEVEQYSYAMVRAVTSLSTSEETLATCAQLYSDEKFRDQVRQFDDRFNDDFMDQFWSIMTRRGTLDGVPKHWNDKGGLQRETELGRAQKKQQQQQQGDS